MLVGKALAISHKTNAKDMKQVTNLKITYESKTNFASINFKSLDVRINIVVSW